MSEKASGKPKKKQVDWHKGAVSAIRLELLDYEDILEYKTEYLLAPPGSGTNHAQRIDLLVIKKPVDCMIPKSIASYFLQFNVFEIKGRNGTLDTDAYQKAISYVSQLIVLSGERNQYTRKDVTLTLVSFQYPRKLLSHLCSLKNPDGTSKIPVEKIGEGVYHICGETYDTCYYSQFRCS